MAKVKTHLIGKKERYKIVGEFFEIVSNLKNKDDVVGFFIGLLSSSEALMLARRIQVAEMLLEEKSYEEIRKKLKVSFQTIAKVYQWLYGENEIYKKQIGNQLERKRKRNKNSSRRVDDGSLLNKYAHHRILKNLLG